MPEEILSKLFGSSARVKAMRLFLLNPEIIFSPREVAARCGLSAERARKEISFLKRIGFIEQGEVLVQDLAKPKKGKILSKAKKETKAKPGKKIKGWRLNALFPLIQPLRKLLVEAVSVDRKKILRAIQSAGRIRLVILSGVFTESEGSRVDVLIVGDGIKKKKIERAIAKIESEAGRELVYAVFSTRDFLYRLDMYDKFIYGILDYPHEKLLNKLDSDKI